MKTISKQLHQLNDFLGFFTKKLRLSNPWNYKVPFLISVPYFVFLLAHTSLNTPVYSIAASVSVIIGVAGIGYLTNDLGDKKKDALISKQNATSNLSAFGIACLILLFLALASMPWLYLPFNRYSLFLLLLQFFLFAAYAFPPFRLKEKGFAGVLTDALYAHVNPAILATYTFYLFGYVFFSDIVVFTALLAGWQLVLGIRNILLHQVKDYENDAATGTKTFVRAFGRNRSVILCKKHLLPIEAVFLALFTVFISRFSLLFLLLVAFYWLVVLLKDRIKPLPLNRPYVFFDNLYIKWMPLFILAILCLQSVYFLPVLALHLVLFKNDIKSFLLRYIPKSFTW